MIATFLRLAGWAFAAGSAIPVLALISTFHLQYARADGHLSLLSPQFAYPIAMAGFLFVLGNGLFWIILRRSSNAFERAASEQADFLDGLPARWIPLGIAVSAGLGLFLELAIIRWQIGIFTVLSFYKNFALLSAFAGLGLGYALASRRHIPLALVIPILGLQVALQMAVKYGLDARMFGEMLSNPIKECLTMSVQNVKVSSQYLPIYAMLCSVFLFTSAAFVPLGQLCGRLMTRTGNLRAYGWNLLGSLAGVLAMQAMSALWTPPAVWFGLTFLCLLPFLAYRPAPLLYNGAAAVAALVVMAWPVAPHIQRIYSPYQIIETWNNPDGYLNVQAAGTYFQTIHNLSKDYVAHSTNPETIYTAHRYNLPFLFRPNAQRVAIVGAGTGNDTAAALRSGAQQIDAVDIDPVILEIGRQAHPEQPYTNPKVRSIEDDARTFFRTTKDTYDLIVYGLLDSHAVLGTASNVRVDSFVYTVEGFREARAQLKEGGILSLSFYVMTPELAQKLYWMLTEAFDGRPPIALQAISEVNFTFVQAKEGNLAIAPDLLRNSGYIDASETLKSAPKTVDVSTDDWPFFYMPRRVYPFSYLGMVAVVLVLTALLLRGFLPDRPGPGSAAFFFLGAGFMLIETKGITELGLLFGNTWQVIGIIIAGVLVMAFLANALIAALGRTRATLPFALLFASLALGYVMAGAGKATATPMGRLIEVALLTCPMFFSGLVFSSVLQSSKDIARILAANLMGAMCGGLLEYNSMRFGVQSLYLFAVALYALAAITWLPIRRRSAA